MTHSGHRKKQTHLTESIESQDRVRFERFLADLSARFVALPPEQVDYEIQNALKKVLGFFQIDRCSLLQLLPDKTSWQAVCIADVTGLLAALV